ncbi:MAG TPA: YlmH/Sll1252 family protein [Bacilli bacterium]|nr:YlmH/Sll1252 family protein [Bacilli bacterium]
MKKDNVFMHYRPQERPFVERMLEVAERVDERQTPHLTDFLDPRQAKIVQAIIGARADLLVSFDGGHEEAERVRALIAPSYWQPETDDFALNFLRLEISGEYVSLSHGDYLGALLGLGLKRGKLGDLSVHQDGCDLVVTQDIADFIRLNLGQAGRANVYATEIERERYRAVRIELSEKEFTVMSLRLDAVASDAFGMSRSKVVDPIKAGKLQLNWQVVEDPSAQVEEGDVLSLRGFGRVKILEVGGQTKKGRTFLKIGKYL